MLIRLTFILIISISVSYSQNSKAVKELTKKIFSENDNDSIKVVKVCNWITKNIKLNTKAFKTQQTLSCDEIISKKIATNQGYSLLFSKILDYAKIKNSQITGYYKGVFYEKNDEFLRANHMWNAVFIQDRWYLFDITLASGYLQNASSTNAYLQKLKWVKSYNKDMLFVDINYFRKTHLPLQKYWQLTNTPITITEFEQNIFVKKKNEKYDYKKQIDANYVKRPKQKDILKNFKIGLKENQKNISLEGLKYNIQAMKKFKPVKRRSISNEGDYKKTIAEINKLNKQASLQFASHIRNVKKLYKQKATRNKNYTTKNTRIINDEVKTINIAIIKRERIIEQFNKKNEIFSSMIEAYEKKKINDENKTYASKNDISKNTKLVTEFNELKKLLELIKKINIDTIKLKIENINILEDSVCKLLSYRYNYEKQKTNFINNFSFNRLSVYNNVVDSISWYKKTTLSLVTEFNSNVDTSYFNIESKIKLLIKQAESHYKKAKTIIVSKKMDNSVFALFNNTIDSIYMSSQQILKTNTSAFKPMIKKLGKAYLSTNKDVLSELENQQKAETERYDNFTKYYNELLNQEVNLFNSFTDKCNKRITRSYDDYKKQGSESLEEVKLIFVE